MPNVLTGVLSGTSSIIRTQPLDVTENGTYNPPSGVDGYKPVTVNVPQHEPVIEQLTATYNGIYNAPSGVDGYDPVVVNVQAPAPVLDDITITENGHYVPPTGVDGYDDITVNVPLPANAYLKQTLSGLPAEVATFNGADAPLDSLKASIVGTQDLHGYDGPWPAGGGKNKLQVTADSATVNGVTFTVNNDGTVAISGTASADTTFNLNTFDFKAGESYILNGCPTGGSLNSYLLSINGVGYDSGSGYTYNPQSDITGIIRIIVYRGTNMNGKVFKPMIRLASVQDATFSPYSNICPISGWTSCEVTDNNNTYTIPFKDSSDNPITVYDGGIDVNGGKLTVTHANIASYNGETINEPWISSEDVYTQGATPTTGAQVVYPLTTPLVYDFDPLALRSNGVTNLSVDCGDITECKYFTQS